MKQLLILSGKGGTGKTTVAAAFIRLMQAKAFADCDVDAPNLHLVIQQDVLPQKSDYYGHDKAHINMQMCIRCGVCANNCRFDAIRAGKQYSVDPYACEGCGVCEVICPARAISLHKAVAGKLMLYSEPAVFSTARLEMGSGTSGLLVSEVKKQMRDAAVDVDLAVIDGSPGIGCPVIASMSGVDMVLIVAEPSVSGQSDLTRILETAHVFGTKSAVCINKSDTCNELTNKIEAYCQTHQVPLVGRIPFDETAVRAVNEGKSIVEYDCASAHAVRDVYKRTMELLNA